MKEPASGFGMSGYGASRFDDANSFGSGYTTPGWQRAQKAKDARKGGFNEGGSPKYVPDGIFNQDPGYVEDDFAGQAAAPGRQSAKRGGGRKANVPLTIEGELVAKSTGTTSEFSLGDRVFHQKFGYGQVVKIDGNKLTIAFEKAGEKKVVDSFVERV